MDKIVEKIDKMRIQRGWSVYKLSLEAGLSQQTIRQWFTTNTIPSITNLEMICEVFGVTLAEFFAEGELIEARDEIKDLYKKWSCLSKDEQNSLIVVMDNYLANKSKNV